MESICSALSKTGNNKLEAAKLLGIHKTTLFRKVKKYGIEK
jgi:transcriptional regulator of acetoin/glycerol metabolism